MTDRPKVSVTIPVLNGERYLSEAIESILAQSERSWELLIVDDGSSDGTSAIADRFAGQRPEMIRVLRHPGGQNRGIVASRNLGLRHSAGRYIARLDADDALRPTAFEDQIAILDTHPSVAMTYGPVEIWRSWSAGTGSADVFQAFAIPFNVPVAPPGVLQAFLNDDRNEPVGMFVRKDVLENVGGYAADGLHRELYEDIVLNVKICLKYPVLASDRSWYRYRQHADSYCAVARQRNDYNPGCMRFLEWVREYFTANEVSEPELWSALGKSLDQQRSVRVLADSNTCT
jgi:glycosyltransferase involved in cell wall biosynthesis